MLKYLILMGLSLTGCVHSSYREEEMDYRIRILEKRIKMLEMDLEYLMDYDDGIKESKHETSA